MRTGIASIILLLCGAGALPSCSTGASLSANPGTYQIEFPSTAAAVAADTVQAFVFANPSRANQTDCNSLIVARQTGAGLPPPEAQTGQVALCDVLGSPSRAQIPGVTFGEVSLLVVTQRNASDYFTGCVKAVLAEGSPPVSVQLEQAIATLRIPPTNCAQVSDRCASPPRCCVGCDGG